MIQFDDSVPGWVRVRFDRPTEKNKLKIALLREGINLFEHIHSCSDRYRVITIESVSDSIFAAGADMNELLDLDSQSALEYSHLGQAFMNLVETCPVEVIGLVCGPCVGGGFDLALSCHRLFGTLCARFAHPGVYLGIVTGFGGTIRLAERVGDGPARQLLLTGQSISGQEAYRMGLVEQLFSSGDAMREALVKEFQFMT